uniref:Rhomboid domain-containing protein n=1 Tax=Heterorhabditis bacteriophora TaxID=37862 RepID=A0A1I7XMM4_HETBA
MDVAQPGQRSSVQITEPHLRRLVNEKSIDKVREQQIMDSILNSLIQSGATPRRARVRGIGVFGALCNRRLGRRKVGKLDPEIRDLIESGSDERPWFTWWVTVVQVVVCLVSILSYGIGPVGWDRVERKDEVMDVSLTLRQVSYYEPANLWIGPKFKDLIRLGAKYSPCMRRERGLWREIQEDRSRENHTGCCVFNDRTGCYQTGQSSCPRSLATWHKWSKPLIRQQSKFDPFIQENKTERYCANPPSVDPYHWPDDLTRWPVIFCSYFLNWEKYLFHTTFQICLETRTGAFLPAHMSCQITGRPCCIQLQGQCRIATKEYCSFVQGYWHENATLCSQVNCFSDVCGMLPFLGRDRPDQFYRLFIALFLHAGIIHCAITVFIQLWLMRDLEKLIGWLRMAILYIGSGIGGNLASAIFVPYNPEVGPSGCQLGILAALLVDVFHHRRIIDNPSTAYRDHALVILGLFASGILPWIDNWAHLFGFIFGLLLTIITFPYLDFAPKEVNRGWLWTSITRRHVSIVVGILVVAFNF